MNTFPTNTIYGTKSVIETALTVKQVCLSDTDVDTPQKSGFTRHSIGPGDEVKIQFMGAPGYGVGRIVKVVGVYPLDCLYFVLQFE